MRPVTAVVKLPQQTYQMRHQGRQLRLRIRSHPENQPRQHEADQSDGVFRSLETHLEDHPRPQPTDRRLAWLTRLPGLPHEILATSAS